MKIIENKAFFGPNLHVDFAANYLQFNIEQTPLLFQNYSPDEFLNIVGAIITDFKDALPASEDYLTHYHHAISNPDTGAARFIGFFISQLLALLGEDISYSDVQVKQNPHSCTLLFVTPRSELAIHINQFVEKLLNNLPTLLSSTDSEKTIELSKDWQSICHYATVRKPTLSSQALLNVAKQRGIPSIQFDFWPYVEEKDIATPRKMTGVIQLGQGKYQQQLLNLLNFPVAAQTQKILSEACEFNQYVADTGLPVPLQDREFTHINNVKRALRSARKIGYPVVIKPRQGNRGNGIFTNINSDAALSAAYEQVKQFDRHVVIERYIKGDFFYLLILGKRVVCVHELKPQFITGDGEKSILELIDQENAVRNEQSQKLFLPIAINAALLAQLDYQGLSLNAIPDREIKVTLNVKENIHSFNTVQNLLPRTNEQVLDLAVSATTSLGLEIACVKMISEDMSKPISQTNTVITDIVPADLSLYRIENEQLPLSMAGQCLDYLFPATQKTRLPIVAITGTNGKTTTCLLLAHILKSAGHKVGVACSNGVYIDENQIQKGIFSGIVGALEIFQNSSSDFAVLETSRGTLIDKGLAFERCEASACLNIASDHIGENGVETLADLARVKRLVVEQARDWAVINAEDPHCLEMMPYISAKKLCLISLNPQTPSIKERLHLGDVAIVLEENKAIYFCTGTERQHIVNLADVPITWDGAALHNVQNVMFAISLALGVGISLDVIRKALSHFSSSISQTPGRLNVYDKLPFSVVIDYAHNGHGFRSLCTFLRKRHQHARKIALCFIQERHREEDIEDIASSIAQEFDYFICRDPFSIKNHEPGEVAALLKQKLLLSGVAEHNVEVIPNFDEALLAALEITHAGDCLVVAATSKYQQVWEQLEKYRLEKFPIQA